MPTAKLIIEDEVNVRVKGLDPEAMSKAQEALTFWVPGYIHMPAYKLGRWDGKIRLFKASGATYLNLVDRIVDPLSQLGYDIEIQEDKRQTYDDLVEKIEFINELVVSEYEKDGKPIILWEHQVNAVNKGIENGGGVLELATGSGKTIICGVLSKIYSEVGNVVVIVPNIDLVVQTQYTFKQIGIDAGMWYGEIKDRKTVTIATWQSLDHFPELFSGVMTVIVDEVHQAKAKVLNEMLSGPAANVPFRFGCTGTLPKEDLARSQILAVLGETIFTLRSWELQHKNILAKAQIYQMRLKDSKNKSYLVSCDHHETWSDELNWIFTDKDRVLYMAETIREVANNMGNTLVLVQYRKHGKILAEALPEATSLDGRDKNRTEVYDKFNQGDNNVLICTFGIASTGIDIPRIFNLIIIEPGKKFEKVMQTLGRGLRRTDDKTHLTVFDICGDSGLSKKHAATRRSLYKEAKQKFEIIEVEYKNVSSDS